MKQGAGFSVTINIIAIFIVVTFAFLVASLNYYKAYKVNNAVMASIEKYEGYNDLSKKEIAKKLDGLGYVNGNVTCSIDNSNSNEHIETDAVGMHYNNKTYSVCIYKETKDLKKTGKAKYKIVTFVNFNIPVINQVLNLPVKTYTEGIYQFNDIE